MLSRIDDDFLKEVREKSLYITQRLKNAKGVKDVSGMGLMLGISTQKDASEVIASCIEKGVLVIKAKDKVRLLPPLNIPMELLCKAVSVIEESLV